MYEALPGISKHTNQMTIEENHASQDLQMPDIVQNDPVDHESAFIKLNTNNWRSKNSSRSSQQGIPISPLTVSNLGVVDVEAGRTRLLSKQEAVIKVGPSDRTKMLSKRTTEEAFAPGKIAEDV